MTWLTNFQIGPIAGNRRLELNDALELVQWTHVRDHVDKTVGSLANQQSYPFKLGL
ncbi:hypothetical protein D3C78_1599320 [compost metagenome]